LKIPRSLAGKGASIQREQEIADYDKKDRRKEIAAASRIISNLTLVILKLIVGFIPRRYPSSQRLRIRGSIWWPLALPIFPVRRSDLPADQRHASDMGRSRIFLGPWSAPDLRRPPSSSFMKPWKNFQKGSPFQSLVSESGSCFLGCGPNLVISLYLWRVSERD